MTYIAKPKLHHPSLTENKVGYTRRDYEGKVSTLCAGCGHDSISAAIIQACWEMDIEPHRVAKLSGIGCSSKTPDYFLGPSHGFNTVHGRMPSVLTGANLANRDLLYLGVSGDVAWVWRCRSCGAPGLGSLVGLFRCRGIHSLLNRFDDGAGDETSGNRCAVVMQDLRQTSRVNFKLIDQ